MGTTVDTVLDGVRARMAKLDAELKRLRVVEEYLLGVESNEDEEVGTSGLGSPEAKNGLGLPGDAKSYDVVAAVLRRAGRPLRASDIAKEMQRAGYGANWSDPVNPVYTTLSRKPEMFRKLDSGLWVLREGDDSESD